MRAIAGYPEPIILHEAQARDRRGLVFMWILLATIPFPIFDPLFSFHRFLI